jgi:hypothetical protein
MILARMRPAGCGEKPLADWTLARTVNGPDHVRMTTASVR